MVQRIHKSKLGRSALVRQETRPQTTSQANSGPRSNRRTKSRCTSSAVTRLATLTVNPTNAVSHPRRAFCDGASPREVDEVGMRSFLARRTLGARLNRRAPYIISLIYLRPARTLLSIPLGAVYYARSAAPDCSDDCHAPRGQRRKGIAGGGRRTPAADPRPHQCAPKRH